MQTTEYDIGEKFELIGKQWSNTIEKWKSPHFCMLIFKGASFGTNTVNTWETQTSIGDMGPQFQVFMPIPIKDTYLMIHSNGDIKTQSATTGSKTYYGQIVYPRADKL